MSLPALSVRRPVFISSIVMLIFFAGIMAMRELPVSLFPQTNVPFVSVSTIYPGASPSEVESAVSQVIEDEIATIDGVKKIGGTSQDSLSVIWVEFRPGMNLDSVEQRLRDRVAFAQTKFPSEVKPSIIERFNPSSQPVLTLFLSSDDLSLLDLNDWITREIKPAIARIPMVGRVEAVGGETRQFDILIEPRKIEQYRLTLLQMASALSNSGTNVPAGSIISGSKEINLRSLNEFSDAKDIERKVVSFGNGETAVRISDLGKVVEGKKKISSKSYYDGKQGVIIQVYRQSKSNALSVADAVRGEVAKLNAHRQDRFPEIIVVRDGSQLIRDNVADVWESIAVGVLLTIVIVYLFLGSIRSTLITGFAIPNSLVGAFLLMSVSGFSINILTLLAMSLSVGLLVDDAIVVRENIFKYFEQGIEPKKAAIIGANEVAMAVVAVTAAVLSMFGPVGFLNGVTGEFFREFGITVCFAMSISLFDGMAVAPMLSAYWSGAEQKLKSHSKNFLIKKFDQLQDLLEKIYVAVLGFCLKGPFSTIVVIVLCSLLLVSVTSSLPSGFLPVDDSPEFSVRVQMPADTNLEATGMMAHKVDDAIKNNPFVDYSVLTIGNASLETHRADIYVKLKGKAERKGQRPREVRDLIRKELQSLPTPPGVEIRVFQNDITGGGVRPFTLVLQTERLEDLEPMAQAVYERIKDHPRLISPEIALRPGIPELQIKVKDAEAALYGIAPFAVGMEIRGRIEGLDVGKLKSNGNEYDIKLKTSSPPDMWLKRSQAILVPNINMTPIDLRNISEFKSHIAPAKIDRVNRYYATRISADLAPGSSIKEITKEVEVSIGEVAKDFPSLKYLYEGDAEVFEEMSESMSKAMLFGMVLLFLVLASLYESFLLSLLNIISLPLAVSGGIFFLWLFDDGIFIYSTIGILMLLGVATKNSILLIDTASKMTKEQEGAGNSDRARLMLEACSRRLRPIIMTSLALIAGSIPIAIGLNEASSQRTGMGIAVIGGTITSTLFTLIFIPCLMILVERVKSRFHKRP